MFQRKASDGPADELTGEPGAPLWGAHEREEEEGHPWDVSAGD